MAKSIGRKYFFMFHLLISIHYIVGFPEAGQWDLRFTWKKGESGAQSQNVSKSMGSGTDVYVQVECPGYTDGNADDPKFFISYRLGKFPVCADNENQTTLPSGGPTYGKQHDLSGSCSSGVIKLGEPKDEAPGEPINPLNAETVQSNAKNTRRKRDASLDPDPPVDPGKSDTESTGESPVSNDPPASDTVSLEDKLEQISSKSKMNPKVEATKLNDPGKPSDSKLDKQPSENKKKSKGEAAESIAPIKTLDTEPSIPDEQQSENKKKTEPVIITYSITEDGFYNFSITITPDMAVKAENLDISVTVKMRSSHGYLSLTDYPLLIFYGFMCAVYIILGLVWLFLLACNWRDLLRMQFWIGAVILLGMIEKAVFVAEYDKLNKIGSATTATLVFAELVSCLKRTLARILVIIASLGFGIVKPRLGPMLHRVLGVGALYFIFASVESCIRVYSVDNNARRVLIASVPLALMDAIICWWIFASLWQTVRTLRLRRNIVKLTLYRHFTNTLIFAVIASLAFFVWYLTQHPVINGSDDCIISLRGKWLTEAFWPLLFSSILVVIMVLWRPTVNNQRYAFSPLLDADEDDADDAIMNDAFEGMKMRAQKNGSPRAKDISSKAEDDLKWIEENIPATLADKALPSILDSDDEIMTTKFEMSKME